MADQKYFRPWGFILPGAVLGVVTLLVPIVMGFRYSLHRIRLFRLSDQVFVGLQNYTRLFEDPLFMMSVRVTFWFTIGCTIFAVVFGLAIAAVMSTRGIRGTGSARFYMAFYLVPFVATQVVVGMLGRLYIWEPEYGMVNWLIGLVGIEPVGWLIRQETALLATTITNSWRLVPLALLVFYAALATIPDSIVESAEVDGASALTIFFRIKLPMIRFHISFVTLIILTSAFREFDLVYALSGLGPGRSTNVLSMLVYHMGLSTANIGLANAISFVMFGMVAVLAIAYIKAAKLSEMRE